MVLKIVNGVNGKIETLFTAIVRFITASKVAGIISMVLLFALFITSVKIIMPLVVRSLCLLWIPGGCKYKDYL